MGLLWKPGWRRAGGQGALAPQGRQQPCAFRVSSRGIHPWGISKSFEMRQQECGSLRLTVMHLEQPSILSSLARLSEGASGGQTGRHETRRLGRRPGSNEVSP